MAYRYSQRRGSVILVFPYGYVRRLSVLLLLLLLCVEVRAQEIEREPSRCSTEISVTFRVNRTEIETEYMDNAARISELLSFLQRLQTDSTVNIENISFCGAASPEGSYEYNKKLAKGRMLPLENDEMELGFDYVLVNGKESKISVVAEVYDKEGELLSRTKTVEVPIVRSKRTIVRGQFLTSMATGNIGIDTDYDGDINIEIV